MIKIKKGKTPDFLLSKTVNKNINKALLEKDEHIFQPYCYANIEKVKPFLEKIYNNKCCYCERNDVGGVDLQVEHFRPKKKPKECEKTTNHFGYYWLGYEWTNLLLCCSTCNNLKSNSFPIQEEKNRINEPTFKKNNELNLDDCKSSSLILINEKSLIFNPEIDNAFEHFIFDNQCFIKGLTIKGKITIEILKLNDNSLLKARNKIVNSYISKFNILLLDFREKNIDKNNLVINFNRIFTNIKQRRFRKKTHTFFSYYLYSNFEKYINISKRIEINEKKQVIKAFKLFINGKLKTS